MSSCSLRRCRSELRLILQPSVSPETHGASPPPRDLRSVSLPAETLVDMKFSLPLPLLRKDDLVPCLR